jgi:Asp-tRNA(Asn)/Glu-tRNA(Gln) amidotransferase A subunit family amidase
MTAPVPPEQGAPPDLAAVPPAPGPDEPLTSGGTPAPGPDEPLTSGGTPAPGPDEPLTSGVTLPASPPAPDAGRGGGAARLGARRLARDGGPWVTLLDPPPQEVTVVADGAGVPERALDGVVVAVKDLVAVAGVPLGAGSRSRDGAPAEPRDAAVVAALRASGATVAGTVALHELAFGVSGVNDELGFPPHPDDPDRIPGGSSSGSAVAVADGTCDLAVGTDTGGSVRIPAALCGVVGFKPAFGTYPLDGVLALAPSLDHVGLLTRSVAALARAHGALTMAAPPGRALVTGEVDLRPIPSPEPVGIGTDARAPRLAVDRRAVEAAEPAVATAVERTLVALAEAGWELVDLAATPEGERWPDPDEVFAVSTTILFAEAAAVHRRLLASPDGTRALGEAVAARLHHGATIPTAEHARAVAAARAMAAGTRAVLATVDAVAGPAVPILAPTIGAARSDPALARTLVSGTRLGNVTGVPAITVPVPGAELPVGFQLLAATNAAALAAGAEVERAAGGPARPPVSPGDRGSSR